MKEIERKFLVDIDRWNSIEKPEPTHIIQAYLDRAEDHVTRIRIKGKQAFLTIKGSNTGITRSEFEFEIPVTEAQEMIALFCPKVIEKRRFEIQVSTHLWEVDEFINPRAGLVLAEIELSSENESFTSPDWIAKEVSHDPSYYNSTML